ncbi:MAG: ATPase [Hyphomonas sp.]|uniref:ATP12 family chaperone protein n=1 Tax=Hyphomonas sp. TaxID=87 RepID=UPI0017EA301F|nr:ATP12 family protein [Hyphomonas sp.]MBU3919835.1 ATPase [Alphaproteobacteria bacterium]MBA3068172.1 ATPase [Hyphomonas sp.]MBU4062095.1 ATPase [Alphaproteobacteria bacterium]MBU4165529.1 ATPase [Alphaproteobacteria bacterium]MBU4569100.1 ATPase [Alphaproteobacteria bacterium]
MTGPETNPKRFYKTAAPERLGEGWTIALDGRTIKTPARAGLVLPTLGLAEALAAEWNAQVERIDLTAMYLTRLANVAIDRVAEARDALAEEVARYCETDLICHIAEEPEELIALEEGHWAPVREWAGDRLGVNLVTTEGVRATPQPDASLDAARDYALSLDDFRLTGLVYACALYGSALLAMAVCEGALPADEAFEMSRLDESWQIARWGEDEESAAATAAKRVEAGALGRWFAGLAG